MANVTHGETQAIINALKEKGINFDCIRCKSKNCEWHYFKHIVFNSLSTTDISLVNVPVVPTVALTCGKCGNISQFAAGVLGLLD